MFKLFLVLLVTVLFGAALLRAARWLVDVLLVLLASAAAATLVGRLLSPDATTATAAGLLVFAVLVPCLWKLRSHLRREPSGSDWRELRLRQKSEPADSGERATTASATESATPWDRLTEAVPGCHARLAVAAKSFDRFRAANSRRDVYDPASHQTLIMIDRRLPELIDAELGGTSSLRLRQQQLALLGLVDLVEELAADCERQLAAAEGPGDDSSAIRLHIERYLEGRRSRTF